MPTPSSIPIQQSPPPETGGARRVLTLPVEKMHPVIRIAHRQENPLNIATRIIFDHELVLILAGTGELLCEDEARSYAPHDLLFLQPFVPHRFSAFDSPRHAHIAVHFDFAPGVPARTERADQRLPYQVRLTHGLALPDVFPLTPGHRLEDAFQALLRERQRDDPLAPVAASQQLMTILIALLRAPRTPAASGASPFAAQNQARMEEVTAYIKVHFAQTLSSDMLAQVAGLSISRLNALFRQHAGYSPMDYVQRARIEEARRLLADVHLSVKEVAARTGFHDTYHFSKAFRHIDGLSPLHYREALLAGRARDDR